MIPLCDKITKLVLSFLQAYPLQWLDKYYNKFQDTKEQANYGRLKWACLSILQLLWFAILLSIALVVGPILLWKHFRRLEIPCHEHFRITPYGEFGTRKSREPQEYVPWKQEGF